MLKERSNLRVVPSLTASAVVPAAVPQDPSAKKVLVFADQSPVRLLNRRILRVVPHTPLMELVKLTARMVLSVTTCQLVVLWEWTKILERSSTDAAHSRMLSVARTSRVAVPPVTTAMLNLSHVALGHVTSTQEVTAPLSHHQHSCACGLRLNAPTSSAANKTNSVPKPPVETTSVFLEAIPHVSTEPELVRMVFIVREMELQFIAQRKLTMISASRKPLSEDSGVTNQKQLVTH